MLVSIDLLLVRGASEIKWNLQVVVDGSKTIGLILKWPSALKSTTKLHQRWLVGSAGVVRNERYHPRLTAFDSEIDFIRCKEHKKIEFVIRVPPPFPVRPNIADTFLLGWYGSDEVVLCVTFTALAEHEDSSIEDLKTIRVAKRLRNATDSNKSQCTDNKYTTFS